MSDLPGNPHAEASEAAQSTAGAQVHATLAVAHELRTQTLQAERAWAMSSGDTDARYDITDEINARIGRTA